MNSQSLMIITGISGSGLSSVLKALEDFGLEVFDNFPLSLLPELLKQKQTKPIAIGIDVRSRDFDIETILAQDAQLLFLTCDNATLLKRFSETRRRHPLAIDRPLHLGIEEEREIMKPLQEKAQIVIDTSELNIHDLRHILEGHFKPDNSHDISISLMSFGFRNGTPREADIMMDVRFLQNPNWVAELKTKTGKDEAVGSYIEKDENFGEFLENFKAMIKPLLPRYAYEGKSYLTIAIGCTGGRHRSVYSVEKLKEWLEDQNIQTHVEHRDLKED